MKPAFVVYEKMSDPVPGEPCIRDRAISEIGKIKAELFKKHFEHFYTIDAIFRLVDVPQDLQQSVRSTLHSGSQNFGIKKINSSQKPLYGISKICPLDEKCYGDWCSGIVKKYGSEDLACPNSEPNGEIVFEK